MAVGDTYTSPAGAIQDNYTQKAREYTSMIRGAPQVKQLMGEQILQGEGMIKPLADEKSKLIEQLFNADTNIAAEYANPKSETYIENPTARYQAVAPAKASMWGSLAGIDTLIGTRQKVLGDALDRGMEMYKAGLDAKALEMDYAAKMQGIGAPNRLNASEMKMQAKEQLQMDLLDAPDDEEQALNSLMRKYKPYLTADEILDAYSTERGMPQALTVADLQSRYRIKVPNTIAEAQEEFKNAKLALDAVKQLDAESKKSQRWYAGVYSRAPMLGQAAAQLGFDVDPVAYEDNRMAVAQDLTKLIFGSNFPGVAKNIEDLIPHAWSAEGVRKNNIGNLYKMVTDRLNAAQTKAGGYALEPRKLNIAKTKPVQPVTPMASSGEGWVPVE